MRCRACHRRLAPLGTCPRHPEERGSSESTPTPASPSVPGVEGLALLGQGGMSVVWRGRHAAGEVAVKVAREGGEARLQREVRALKLLGPPATPAFIEEGRTPTGEPYLVMERLAGRTLAEWMAARADAAVPPGEAIDVLALVAVALDRVHGVGWVHRDLKPENVFLVEGGGVRLLDFGLARPTGEPADADDPALTLTGQRLGTPTYMAPEQCYSVRSVDARADVYALAVLAFELLAGRPPFVGAGPVVVHAHVGKRPPRPSAFAPASAAVDDTVLKGLAKDPSARFGGAGELVTALREALAAGPPAAAPRRAAAAVRPVALVGLRTNSPAAQLAAGGHVVAMTGDRVVVAFTDFASLEHALRAAVRAARSLVPLSVDGRAVVHAAPLKLRHAPRGVVAIGAALAHLDAWWPASGAGVVVTADAAAAGDIAPGDADTLATPRPRDLPLRGRDGVVADVVAVARAAFADAAPTLVTVSGEPGLGKTRLLDAVADRLAADAEVVRLCPRAGSPPDELVTALLATAFGVADPPDLGAAREAAGEAWPAVAFTLGWLAEDHPAVQALLAVPGALRHAVAGAAAHGLLRRPTSLLIVLDDAHLADHVSLDALELATLDGKRGRLAVVVAGAAMRAGWGERAARVSRLSLAPLSPAAARAVLFDHLHPVEFVPDAVVERILHLTGSVPGMLAELGRALWDGGAVRRRPGEGAGWYLAADELLDVSANTLAERLVERSVAGLPPSAAAIATVCAAFAGELTAADVAAVQPADVDADAGVAMSRLARAGILEPAGGDRWRFRRPLVRDALEARTPPALRRALHAAILRRLLSGEPANAAAIARHAAKAGDDARAAAAYQRLADEARRRHRYVDAEQGYTAALAHTQEEDAARRELYFGRAQARYRLDRYRDALADLRAARALATDPGDLAEILLLEATVLDWMSDFAASEAVAQEAAAIAPPALRRRCDLALGRSLCRTERLADGVALLARVADDTAADYETRVIALTLVPGTLVLLGRLEEAERRFDELIWLCEAAGDTVHLGAAHQNRQLLWMKRDDRARMAEDSRRAIDIARELGNTTLERRATYNLAEMLYWRGELDEARRLARRSRELQVQSFGEGPDPYDALLLARIACAAGDLGEARAHLDWIRAQGLALAPLDETLVRTCELVVKGGTAAEWAAVVREAEQASQEHEHREVLAFADKAMGRPPVTPRD